MNRFTIFCTEEPTRKAFELGAPIELESEYYNPTENDFKLDNPIPCESFTNGYHYAKCPTAGQMIGWLEEQYKMSFEISEVTSGFQYGLWIWDEEIKYLKKFKFLGEKTHLSSRKEATIAAIDAALEQLTNKK